MIAVWYGGCSRERDMPPLSRQRVLEIVGETDDHTIAQIIATGASEGELIEAVSQAEQRVREGRPAPGPLNPRIDRLCAILNKLAAIDDEAFEENPYE